MLHAFHSMVTNLLQKQCLSGRSRLDVAWDLAKVPPAWGREIISGLTVYRLILTIFAGALALTVASFGGALHGLGDSLAVFRGFWLIGLAVSSLTLLIWNRRIALAGVLTAALAALPQVSGMLRANPAIDAPYTLYQKNLLFLGRDRDGILADIIARAPDFVTLQEVSSANRTVFYALSESYLSSLLCRFAGVGGVAVLSRYPVVAGTQTCAGDEGMAAMQVTTPDGPVWLVSLHLHWPYPKGQREQLGHLLPELERLQGPVLLGGDFNMVPWSYTMRAVQKATGSKRAGPVVATYMNEDLLLRLSIDHILVPGGVGQLSVLPLLGSDHVGLLLRFDL